MKELYVALTMEANVPFHISADATCFMICILHLDAWDVRNLGPLLAIFLSVKVFENWRVADVQFL